VVAALLRRSRLLLALAATACLTPTDPGAGDVGELRIRPQYASGAEPGTLGVTVDSAAVVADSAMDPVAPAVDAVVELPAPDSSLAWLVDVAGDTLPYHVRLALTGGGVVLYRGEADVPVVRGGLGSGGVHEVPVTYVGPGAIAEITVTPGSATLVTVGGTQPFEAVARDADGEVVDATFTWTSDNGAVATVDGASGVATARATGATTITASAKGMSGAASLTVAEGGLFVEVTPASLTLPAVAATRQLSATARDASGTAVAGATFSWSATRPAVVSVDDAGLATAVTEGTGLVIAETGGVADTAEIGVAVVTTIAVEPPTTTLASLGATQQYTAVARRANGDAVDGVEFTWTSSDESVATVNPATGLATAVAQGDATITARAGALSDDAALTVAQAVARIDVTPDNATLTAAGATQAFTAVARDANGNPVAGATFAWSSANAAAAGVDPATGVATAIATGQSAITASMGGVSGSAVLTVALGGLIVSVTPDAATLTALGAARQLDASASDAGGTPIPDAVFTWTTRDPAVATVDPSGLVTATGEGAVWIVASTGSGADSAAVTVAVPASVEVSPATATLTAFGHTQPFTAVVRDGAGTTIPGAEVVWSSDGPAVATVNGATGVATAVGNGVATITATSESASGSASLTVAQTVATLEVTPGATTLEALGATQAFTALARDDNGNALARPVAFAWAIDRPEVATVDAASGIASAVANGAAILTASAEGVSGAATLTVDQRVTAVEVTPATALLAAFGAASPFTAVGRDANGFPVPDLEIAWTAADPVVATVDAAGLVTAIGNGETSVTAAVDGVVGSALVTVRQAVATIAVSPPAATFAALRETLQLTALARDANGNGLARPVTFTWSSDRPDVATVDAATGLATAAANGAATVTASAEGVTGAGSVTVDQVVTAVEVTPDSATLTALGDTQAFAATGRDANGFPVADASFTWSSLDGAVATVDPATGVATAMAPGTVTVRAIEADGASGAGTLAVSPVIVTVEVTPATATLVSLGETFQLAAVARDANGNAIPGVVVAWTAAEPGVATVDAATGLVTAIGNGGTAITASAGGVSGGAGVTVQQVVASVEVTPGAATLAALGDAQAFTALARDALGSPVTDAAFMWSSADPAVATVDPGSGLALAVGNGAVAITAAADGVAGAATLTVRQVVVSIEVTPAEATLTAVGATQQFLAISRDANGNAVADAVLVWDSSDPGVATVDPATGLATAAASGAATITARLGDVAGSAALQVCLHVAGAPPGCGGTGRGHSR
jgi:uncharacterized protein YjdB